MLHLYKKNMTTQSKTNTNTNNIDALENYFNALLESEWLWDIDSKEWFKEIISSTVNQSLDLLDVSSLISDLEEIHQVKFEINNEESELIIRNPIWQVIGYFRPRYYSHGKIEIFKHIERHIEPEYRWKWLWTAMDKVWRLKNLPNLETEVSHKPSNLIFLQNIGYKIVGYYDDNWEVIELSEGEIYSLEKQLKSLALSWDKDLDFSYYLSKNWRIESDNYDFEY